jgi:hypothetical protein
MAAASRRPRDGDARQAAPLCLDGGIDVVHIHGTPRSWIEHKIAGNKGAGSYAQFVHIAGLRQWMLEMKSGGVSGIGLVRWQEVTTMRLRLLHGLVPKAVRVVQRREFITQNRDAVCCVV